MHRLSPALDAPALLAADLALLQISKLPQVVHRVELSNLHEPGAHALHDLPPGLEAAPPVCLPLQQVAGVQRVRAEFEEAAQLARRSGRPEGKLLHERAALGVDERLQFGIKIGELGVVLDGVERGVVALISLVLPNVNCGAVGLVLDASTGMAVDGGALTKRVAVAHLGPPAAHQMHIVLGRRRHLGVPFSYEFSVFVDLVRLDLVEDDRVHVLAAGQDLREAALNVLVQFAALGSAVDER